MQEDADASTAEEQRLMRVLKPTHDTWRSTFTSRSAHPSSEVVGSCERENARELCCAAQALVALRRTQKTGTFPVVTLEQICTKVLELWYKMGSAYDIPGTISPERCTVKWRHSWNIVCTSSCTTAVNRRNELRIWIKLQIRGPPLCLTCESGRRVRRRENAALSRTLRGV